MSDDWDDTNDVVLEPVRIPQNWVNRDSNVDYDKAWESCGGETFAEPERRNRSRVFTNRGGRGFSGRGSGGSYRGEGSRGRGGRGFGGRNSGGGGGGAWGRNQNNSNEVNEELNIPTKYVGKVIGKY